MATLNDLLRASTILGTHEREWLHLLVSDWQLISDLSFADLVLWVKDTPEPGRSGSWVPVAHVRPNTGQMVFYDDVVSRGTMPHMRGLLDEAWDSRQAVRAPQVRHRDDMRVREEAFPVVRAGEPIAVLSRHTNLGGRTPTRLELTYVSIGDELARMVAEGAFPSLSTPTGGRRGAPRVGDGVIRLDGDGLVTYASPNAISAIHRLGHKGAVIGTVLATIVSELLSRSESPVDESLALVLTGRAAWRSELTSRSATISMRAVPLTERGTRTGALVLSRDVTELRRRERELLTKEATIREIHHRVKNNLQTVAALLRLQGRRLPEGTARTALEEAVRRVGTIALVHETLSQGFDETVDFDEIAVRGLQAVVEVATSEHRVHSTLIGTFGRVRAEDSTAMAMIISELVQNAAEHGLAEQDGMIEVRAERSRQEGDDVVEVTITDDGAGLPEGFVPGAGGLGTRIVQSLVADLRGSIEWSDRDPHGTVVRFVARLRPVE
ncbi:MAG: sensor histidine kinase [Actinomycetia bacterium]|nr:sensor histidine kinase [Actinomycetes bacterium]